LTVYARALWLAVILGLFALAAHSYTLATFKFDDPAKDEEFRQLTEQIRCLVCQNESLAGSNAELAEDLRREIYEMMLAGKDREQIVSFLVARYGDFVLYDPPMKLSTYPIWFGPFLLLAIAGFVLYRVLTRKRSAPEAELSEEDEKRVSALLAQQDTPEGTTRKSSK